MHFELVRPEIEVSLPTRATKNSCGYDFVLPEELVLAPHERKMIKTNITVAHDNADPARWVLLLYPRSSLGKRGFRLQNTTGVVDYDYCGFEIGVLAHNDSDEPITLTAGERFVQGVFMPYYITSDDDAFGDRVGGFGSTGK